MLTDNPTDGPSSRLAKGVAKEKEIAADLQALQPYADVQVTSQTGDGGYDILVEGTGEKSLIEVKDWNRSLSAYQVREYASRHTDTDADFTIFNTGGFTDGAKEAAEEAGIELLNGAEHETPSQLRRVTAAGIRRCLTMQRRARAFGNSLGQRATEISVRASEAIQQRGEQLIKLAHTHSKLSPMEAMNRQPQLLALFVAVLGLGGLWLLWKQATRSLSKEDKQKITRLLSRIIITLVIGIVLGLVVKSLIRWLRSK